ncbi:MAG: sigma-70 family RNA polymerase sigma factor [Planctomycetota bacterium]|nr:sigma-70 family RNA polymerase sigma factor [Planctomycetota bacterium]
MNEWTQAERYMLDEIRRGNGEAWSQLVGRYEGRLTAFARRRVPRGTDPEDLVQDTFLLFLRGLSNFREQASLETFLFVILRRRLADLHRGKRIKICELPGADESGNDIDALPAPDPTASWYARKDEHREAARQALTTALRSLIEAMKDGDDFRDLQIAESLFFAQWPNRQIAGELGIGAEYIALLKHRWANQLRERVATLMQHRLGEPLAGQDAFDALDSLLSEIWEDQRPSCPKRSTIGGFILGTLDEPWQRFVEFHIHRLGCAFCKANLDDLQLQTVQNPSVVRDKVLQSTVGFFRKV